MTTIELSSPALAAPKTGGAASVDVIRVTDRRWRVVGPSARVLGIVDATDSPGGWRYRASRYQAATRTFRSLGEFWSSDDAIDCLRYSR
jgi:hypothetical protein